jgi:hypothetical protein
MLRWSVSQRCLVENPPPPSPAGCVTPTSGYRPTQTVTETGCLIGSNYDGQAGSPEEA